MHTTSTSTYGFVWCVEISWIWIWTWSDPYEIRKKWIRTFLLPERVRDYAQNRWNRWKSLTIVENHRWGSIRIRQVSTAVPAARRANWKILEVYRILIHFLHTQYIKNKAFSFENHMALHMFFELIYLYFSFSIPNRVRRYLEGRITPRQRPSSHYIGCTKIMDLFVVEAWKICTSFEAAGGDRHQF